jgi:hypothetical protein
VVGVVAGVAAVVASDSVRQVRVGSDDSDCRELGGVEREGAVIVLDEGGALPRPFTGRVERCFTADL